MLEESRYMTLYGYRDPSPDLTLNEKEVSFTRYARYDLILFQGLVLSRNFI